MPAAPCIQPVWATISAGRDAVLGVDPAGARVRRGCAFARISFVNAPREGERGGVPVAW